MTREEISDMIANAVEKHAKDPSHGMPPCAYLESHRSWIFWAFGGLTAAAVIFGGVVLNQTKEAATTADAAAVQTQSVAVQVAEIRADVGWIKTGISDLKAAIGAKALSGNSN